MSKSPLAAKVDALQEKRRDGGFTLIELLVVVVIIGILVAIAIPLYLQYQNGAKNKSAESDLRGAISTVETYYGQNNNTYPDSNSAVYADAAGQTAAVNSLDFSADSKATLSKGDSINYVKSTDGKSYLMCSWNKDGKHWFVYNSATGGSVTDKGSIDTLPASCVAA